jgi:hypothetical protein
MKRSVNDPDAFEWSVYCDDKLLDYCIEADDEEGYAECLHCTGENKERIFVPWDIDKNKPYTDIIKGKIEFKHV